MHTERPFPLPIAARLLVWLLLCLLPLQGLAAVLVQSLGALHFHAQPAAAEDPMHGWQDFRRQIDGNGHGHAGSVSRHAHDDMARHHHPSGAAEYSSTVMVDAGAGDADEAFAGASGALGQVIGPLGAQAVPPGAAPCEAWPKASAMTIVSWLPASIERPPRAG